MQNGSYETLSLTTGLVSEINNQNQLVDVSQLNTASFLLDIVTYPIYNRVNLKGFAMDKYMIIYADSSRNVLGYEPKNLAYYGDYVYLNIPAGTKYIAFNFYDISNHPAEVKIYRIKSIAESSNFYAEINEDLYLNQDGSTTPTLTTGFYFLKQHTLYYHDSEHNTTQDINFYNGMFFFDNENKGLDLTGVNMHPTNIYRSYSYRSASQYWNPTITTLDQLIWNNTGTFSRLRTSIPSSGNDNDVATIDAVRTYVGSQSGTNFYTEIDENITLNADGTSSYTFTDKTYYYLKPSRTITYYDDTNTARTTSKYADSIFYYEGDSTTKTLNRTGVNTDSDDIGNEQLSWTSSNNYWTELYVNRKWFVQNSHVGSNIFTRDSIPVSGQNNDVPTIEAVRNYVGSSVPTIATSITSSSTNTEVAGAKAVYDNAIAFEDISSSITYTPASGATINTFTAYKQGNKILLIISATFSTAQYIGITPICTISGATPLMQCYGMGTSYLSTGNPATVFCAGRLQTNGTISAIANASFRDVTFNIEFPLA